MREGRGRFGYDQYQYIYNRKIIKCALIEEMAQHGSYNRSGPPGLFSVAQHTSICEVKQTTQQDSNGTFSLT